MNQYYQEKYLYWLKCFHETGNQNFFARAQFYKMKREEYYRIDNYFDCLESLMNEHNLKTYNERGDDELSCMNAMH